MRKVFITHEMIICHNHNCERLMVCHFRASRKGFASKKTHENYFAPGGTFLSRMTDSSKRSQNSESAVRGSGSRASRAILQGLPHGKPEVVAIGTEATARFQDVTLQRVWDALQGKEWSFAPNGCGPYKVLVPRDPAEQVSS